MLLLSWNVHIHHHSTQDPVHCPSTPDDLGWKHFLKRKNNKRAQIQTETHRRAYPHRQRRPQGQQTYTPWNALPIPARLITEEETKHQCGLLCVQYLHRRPEQKNEPVMKHFMLIVFVYERINSERAKWMMGAHTHNTIRFLRNALAVCR